MGGGGGGGMRVCVLGEGGGISKDGACACAFQCICS